MNQPQPPADRLTLDPEHVRRARHVLANQGIEFSPAELEAELDRLFGKLQAFMKDNGYTLTKEQCRADLTRMFAMRKWVSGLVMNMVREHGSVPVEVMVQCIASACADAGVFPDIVRSAVTKLEESGEVVRVGDSVQLPW